MADQAAPPMQPPHQEAAAPAAPAQPVPPAAAAPPAAVPQQQAQPPAPAPAPAQPPVDPQQQQAQLAEQQAEQQHQQQMQLQQQQVEQQQMQMQQQQQQQQQHFDQQQQQAQYEQQLQQQQMQQQQQQMQQQQYQQQQQQYHQQQQHQMHPQHVAMVDPQTIAIPPQGMSVPSSHIVTMPPQQQQQQQQQAEPVTHSLAQLMHPATSYKNAKVEQQYITSLKQAMMTCYKTIVELARSDGTLHSEYFNELPDREEYPDYYRYIDRPIALDTILEKINNGLYRELSRMAEDVRLMFANAKVYNEPESQVYSDAEAMEKAFDHAYDQQSQMMARERALLNATSMAVEGKVTGGGLTASKTTNSRTTKALMSKAGASCPICGQHFAVRSSISRHLKRKHKLSPADAAEVMKSAVDGSGTVPGVLMSPPAEQPSVSAKRRLAASTSRIPDVVDPEVEDLILDCIKRSKAIQAGCPGPVTTRPARTVMFIVKMGKSIYPQAALKLLQLREQKIPVHYRELTRQAHVHGLVQAITNTTHITMNSQLNRCLDFYPAGQGYFGLSIWRDEHGIVPGCPIAQGQKVPQEYVEGERPTESMLLTSQNGRHALPAAELTAIMAMERAVERGIRLNTVVPVLEAVVCQQEAEVVQARIAEYDGQLRNATEEMSELQSRVVAEPAPKRSNKKSKRGEDDATPSGSNTRSRRSKGGSTIYDEYWRGKDRPQVSSLHKNLHIGVMSANAGRCATAMPWLQRALGYDVKGEAV